MTPLRALHINLGSRGIGQYGFQLSLALSRCAGIEVVSILRRDVVDASTMFMGIPVPPSVIGVDPRSSASVVSAVFRHSRFEHKLVHNSAGSIAFSGVVWSLLASVGRPLLITEHDPAPHLGMGGSPRNRVSRALLRRKADGVIVHGSYCLRTAVGAGFVRDRLVEIPMGHFGFLDRGLVPFDAREPKTVLFFGALRPNKGVELLPEIARRMLAQDAGARMIIAGSPRVAPELMAGEWSGRLSKLLTELRALPNCEVHDRYIPDEEVEVFFRRAAIVVLPYLEASQSAVALVGQAFGCCVVATHVGDLPGIVHDGVTGVLTKPEPGAIAEAVGVRLADPRGTREMGSQAREVALRDFSWSRVGAMTVEAYKRFAREGTDVA